MLRIASALAVLAIGAACSPTVQQPPPQTIVVPPGSQIVVPPGGQVVTTPQATR